MEDSKWKLLKDYASSLSIQFIVDVFGDKSLATAVNIGIDTVKVLMVLMLPILDCWRPFLAHLLRG